MKRGKILLWFLLFLWIAFVLIKIWYKNPEKINQVESPLILQNGWDELIFVGEHSPIDKSWKVPKWTQKVIRFRELAEVVKRWGGTGFLQKLSGDKIVAITDEGGFARSALMVLWARQNGMQNVGWVNGNNFENWVRVPENALEKIRIEQPLGTGKDLKALDFGKYGLVIEPYEEMLSSWDVLVYLGAGIDKKADIFSGLINSWTGQVCDIYLGNIADKKGFDYQEFEARFKNCFSFKPDKIYFWYPKYWRRSSVPILFLNDSQYLKD